jgi:superfamily I DNA/RNA helicase
MAEVLPKNPIGQVSAEVLKVFRRLRAIPGDEFRCRWALPINGKEHPNFLVIFRERYAFLLAVSTVSQGSAETVFQPSLPDPLRGLTPTLSPETFAAGEERRLADFITTAHERSSQGASQLVGFRGIVLFPNVAQTTLDSIQNVHASNFIYLGKEALGTDALGKCIAELAVQPLDPAAVDLLRQFYSPEIIISAEMVARRRATAQSTPGLAEYLLDYDQENAVKTDLALSEEAEGALGASNPRLVTGVAGSGKTLVLLFRAALNAKLHPYKRMLILTHNKPLIADLRRRLRLLAPDIKCECIHFLSWCSRRLGGGGLDILKPFEQEHLIHEAAAQVPGATEFPLSFLRDEIEWLKDYDVECLDKYLRARRVGWGRGLNESQRRRVYQLFRKYQALLVLRGRDDWSGLPLRLLQKVREGKAALPVYDCVFVDEAQFFAPVWLKLVQFLVHSEGQLLLAADPTQGFLKRRESWSASGLKVRGRTVRLQRAYRNTRCIIEHAANFYRRRLPNEDEDINLPEPEQMLRLAEGVPPRYLPAYSMQDEVRQTCTEVRRVLAKGARPQDILIIACDAARVQPLVQYLNQGTRAPIAADAQNEDSTERIRVCSLNAATGLEAAVVLLLGAPQMLEKEGALNLSTEDRQDLRRDNTRRLYMAFTRATDRLVVFSRPGAALSAASHA